MSGRFRGGGGTGGGGAGATGGLGGAEDVSAALRTLAAAMQRRDEDGSAPIKEEDAARAMGDLLERLAAGTGGNDGRGGGGGGAASRARGIGGKGGPAELVEEAVPHARRFFLPPSPPGPSSTSGAAGAFSSHARRERPRRRPRPAPAPGDASRIREQCAARYAFERSLLRELVVLTMRRSDGDLLRFVPSPEEQMRIRTGGNGGDAAAGGAVPEGVKIAPNLEWMPEWDPSLSDDEDESFQGSLAEGRPEVEDLRLRADFCSNRSDLPPQLLGSGARDAVGLCGECGFLYGRIASYVESVLEDDVDGLRCATSRALAARLDRELGDYHAVLAGWEGELPPEDLPQASTSPDSSEDGATKEDYLTLRSLAARVPPVLDRLRTLAILADGTGARDLRGGKLLASVLRHSLDGSGRLRSSRLARSIAADCSVPWYGSLRRWLTQGTLEDVHGEFFVREVAPTREEMTSSSNSGFFTWHRRYVLVEGMIPTCSGGGSTDVITYDLASEVLSVGKGINFVRRCLRDKEWEVSHGTEADFVTLSDVVYEGDDQRDVDEPRCLSTLRDAVAKSSARVNSHILRTLEERHHLTRHLRALKNFLFLGQGDFVSAFVEGLDRELRRESWRDGSPAKKLHQRTLSGVLDASLQTTNARFLPEYVLGNLRARLMSGAKDDGYDMGPPPRRVEREDDDVGFAAMVPWTERDSDPSRDPWNHVLLDYRIDGPLDAIVHASARETYRIVSIFLLRLKRAEWTLNASWRMSTALNHAILVETRAGGAESPEVATAAERSSYLLRRIASTRQTMLHFVTNLQNYLMFEVLEGGWEGLIRTVKRARTLDDVVRAHDSYLNEIVDKTLLADGEEDVRGGGKGSATGGEGGRTVGALLRDLLAVALEFGKFQDHVFSESLAGLDRAARIRKRVEERADGGDWGRKTLDEEEGRVFRYLADAGLFAYVVRASDDFDAKLSDLLTLMGRQIDEVDCEEVDPSAEDDLDEYIDPVMAKNRDALPFLLFRLDFSGYYARRAREGRKKKKQSKS